VSVTGTNAVNSLTAETTVQVVAEAQAIQGLDAAYDGPTSLGAPTTFFATVNQGTNVVYGWDFGDGVFGAGPRVEHTYATPGTYSVVVTASNTLGSASRTLDAIVLGSPGELNPRSFLPLIRR
jgi:PKD repeat protein